MTQLSAFWNRNHPNGIDVTLLETDGDLDSVLESVTVRLDALYARAAKESRVAEFLTDIYTALTSIGLADKTRPLPQSNRISAIGNIWLLERYGFLQPDEYNGLQLEFEDIF